LSQSQNFTPDNLVALHPASTFRSVTPLATLALNLGALMVRRTSEQIERNGRLLADQLTCADVSKIAHLNQSWLADSQRNVMSLFSDMKDLTQKALLEVAERVEDSK